MCRRARHTNLIIMSDDKNLEKKEEGKEVIALTEAQLAQFAGNAIQLQSGAGDPYLVMSSQAYKSLTEKQRTNIEAHLPILHSDLTTIETLGGGSARCMIAEVFLPKLKDLNVIIEEDEDISIQ